MTIDTQRLRELAEMTPEQNTDYERLKQAAASVWFAGNMYIGPSMRELMRFLGEYKRLSPEYEQPATAPVAYMTMDGIVASRRQVETNTASTIASGFTIPLYTEPPANNQSEQHLEMVNAPVPSVPDEFYNAVANLSVDLEELVAETSGVYGLHLNGDPSPWGEILEGGRFELISSLHVVQNLLAARPPEQPADLARDAERYRWLRTYNTAKHPAVTEAFFLGDENLDAEIDAAIAAEKGGA